MTEQRPELTDSAKKKRRQVVQTPGRSSRGRREEEGEDLLDRHSLKVPNISEDELRKHEQNIQHTSTTLPILGHQLGKSLPRNNLCDDPSDDLRLQQRAGLCNFELNARHTSCAPADD